MAHLACRSCGRQIYTVAPIEALFMEERRCSRCGAGLHLERRTAERRSAVRRQVLPDEPPVREQRLADRRQARRRQNAPDGTHRVYGWSAR